MYEMFQAFDLPDSSTPTRSQFHCGSAPGAVHDERVAVLKCTRSMAEKLLQQISLDDAARNPDAYERALHGHRGRISIAR